MNLSRILLITVFLLILCGLVACNYKTTSAKKEKLNQLLDPPSDESWGGDVSLTITDITTTSENKIIIAKALYNRDTVGIQILVPKKNVGKDGFGNGLEITTLGRISDNFLKALSAIYKLKTTGVEKFKQTILASYVDLSVFAKSTTGQEPSDEDGFVTYKLFFEDAIESDEGEAEVFFNINEAQKIIQLKEKDEEYRKPLINAFLQKN